MNLEHESSQSSAALQTERINSALEKKPNQSDSDTENVSGILLQK